MLLSKNTMQRVLCRSGKAFGGGEKVNE